MLDVRNIAAVLQHQISETSEKLSKAETKISNLVRELLMSGSIYMNMKIREIPERVQVSL